MFAHKHLFPCTSLLLSAHCSACIDSFCPQCQFFLFVERLQLSCHENTPVFRIVSASCKYYLLLYGSIVTYCKCRCKSWGGLTLTLLAPNCFSRRISSLASRACNRSTFFAILSFLLLKIVNKKILGHLVGNAVALRQIVYGLQKIRTGAALGQPMSLS